MVAFEFGAAAAAGLISGGVMLLMLYAGIAMMPDRMRMDLLLMLGGMLGLTGGGAYLAGLVLHAMMSIAFGVVHGAIFAAADIDSALVVWGLVFGLGHAVVSGIMLGLMPMVHPLIRDGRMEAPGVLATNLGRDTAVGFVMLHLVFGAIVAVLYDAFL